MKTSFAGMLRAGYLGRGRAGFGRLTMAAMVLAGLAPICAAQDQKLRALEIKPHLITHVTRRASGASNSGAAPVRPKLRVAPKSQPRANSGSTLSYTCAPNIASSTCSYLNTIIAGNYNSTFTNANANVYIQYGTTSLGETSYFMNLVTYSQYFSALNTNANKSVEQSTALNSLNTFDAGPYGAGNVEVTVALGRALGFTGLMGISATGQRCPAGESNCYDAVITVTNDPDLLYYDDQGGTEPADFYDFYAIVQNETDKVFGTSSCISTQNTPLTDVCDFESSPGTGTPSAADLFRWSSPGELQLDSSLSQAPGQYFSYDGGADNDAYGAGGAPKYYNTLDNGDDYGEFVSSPQCGENLAIQDAEGCPGVDHGLTILNDGQSEIAILNAVGFDVPPPATAMMSLPTPGSTLAGSSASFTWTLASGATGYALWVGTSGAGSSNLYQGGVHNVTSLTVNGIPQNGQTVYVRLWTSDSGTLTYNDYTYIESSAMLQGAITSPSPSSTLPGSTTMFSWSAGAGTATGYALWVGTTGPGSDNLYQGGVHNVTSLTINNLPTTGVPVYVRLYTSFSGTLAYTDYTYTAAKQAVMTSPTNGGSLAGPTQTFIWAAGGGSISGYALWVGTTGAGSHNLLEGGFHTTTSATVSGLPTTGVPIYVRLYTNINGAVLYTDYTYAAAKQAVMSSPTNGSTLAGSSQTFTWAAGGSTASGYALWVGTTGAGSHNIYEGGVHNITSLTVGGLPTTGGAVYVRLYTSFNGTLLYNDYTYTAK